MVETHKRTFSREEVETSTEARILWYRAFKAQANPVLYTVDEDNVTFWWRTGEAENQ